MKKIDVIGLSPIPAARLRKVEPIDLSPVPVFKAPEYRPWRSRQGFVTDVPCARVHEKSPWLIALEKEQAAWAAADAAEDAQQKAAHALWADSILNPKPPPNNVRNIKRD